MFTLSTKNKKKNKKSKQRKNIVPKTLIQSIPYERVYENGIFEIEEGVFSKNYKLHDINFKTATNEEQLKITQLYAELMGSFEQDVSVEITLYNRTIDIEEFQQEVLMEMRVDSLNHFREEYNTMLLDKMSGAKNNLIVEQYMTVSLSAENIIDASETFSQIDHTINETMSLITQKDTRPMSYIERLEILNSIYNQNVNFPLYQKKIINGKEVESFSLKNCAAQGITTKEVIAPSGLKFSGSYSEIGEVYAKSFYVTNYPSWIRGTVLTDFSSLSTNMLVSAYFNTMSQEETSKLIRRQSTNINAELVDKQKTASKSGYDASLVSPDLQEAKLEAKELREDIYRENARLFTTNLVITIFANTKEELNKFQEQLLLIANKNMLSVKPVINFQEAAFNSSLPLGGNQLKVQRLMTSNTISAIVPFSVKDIRDKDGLYYGLNAASKNMILFNRVDRLNPCGCILGMPGGGKSFAAKREMINVLLDSGDAVYVIDPDREYLPLAQAFAGSVVKLSNGSNIHINPFDFNMENVGDESNDPIKVKSDFITTICELAIGGRMGLSPIEKSLISRCVIKLYEDHIRYLESNHLTIDYNTAPTMKDFYELLISQPEMDAQRIALALERFVNGSCDVFSYHTNVDIDNRFTVFDIKDIGSGLTELGLQIALDNIWNKMIENNSKGVRTWIYIDEFHVLMSKESSAKYIQQLWKRARKWGGVPTAITQNVEDMLKSGEARTIINNSDFLMMLSQSPMNKAELSKIFSISPSEQKYISRSKPGMGLLKLGDSIIPMDDAFPENTELYKIMTTKFGERQLA